MNKKTNNPPALIIRRVINAKRDKVFAAWSNPEMMSQWFVGGPGKAIVTNDFRVGGNYENKMILATEGDTHQGCGTPGGPNAYIHSGQYLEIIPPEKIVFTWNSHLVADSRVTIELRDCGDTTDLTLTHELLETEELRQKHTGGWNHCLTNLANYLG